MNEKSTHLSWYQQKVKEYLSQEDLKRIMQKSVLRSALEITHTWGWILFAMLISAIFPNPVIIIISMFIIGGKQLACAIIMHDASHDALFSSRKTNNFMGNWFGAYPIFLDVKRYRPYHNKHHRSTGLDADPDLNLAAGYPASRASFARKIMRDLLGLTGIKGQIGIWGMHLGIFEFDLGGKVTKTTKKRSFSEVLKQSANNLTGPISANGILLLLCVLAGFPYLYLLWLGSLLTTYTFCLRIRSMSEHSMVNNRYDPKTNTRTTYANWIERMLFAPHFVNYHAEHHLLMGAPPYNYPLMHDIIKAKGYYNDGELANGYLEVINKAIDQ